jgi:hypothetical protein
VSKKQSFFLSFIKDKILFLFGSIIYRNVKGYLAAEREYYFPSELFFSDSDPKIFFFGFHRSENGNINFLKYRLSVFYDDVLKKFKFLLPNICLNFFHLMVGSKFEFDFGFGFGSIKKFRILSDSDPQN